MQQLEPPALIPGTGPLAVTLCEVTFAYPGATAPVLVRLNFDIPAGSLIAVTGPVGSGKSALAQVLLGLLPRAAGTVLLDGRALDTIPVPERAARIGYLPQEPVLFSGSVRENILLPVSAATLTDAQQDTAWWSVQVAALSDDILRFPDGLDTLIGELGVRVSGGQRQRIALARALAAPTAPGLLVLDDPFSALDVDTEAKIIHALRTAFGPTAPYERRATIVLISHRLAVFPQADQVLVLEHGQITECGTHPALLAAGGMYARIFAAQQRASHGSMEVAP